MSEHFDIIDASEICQEEGSVPREVVGIKVSDLPVPKELDTEQFFSVVRHCFGNMLSISGFEKAESLDSGMARRALSANVGELTIEQASRIAIAFFLCIRDTMTAIERSKYYNLNFSMGANTQNPEEKPALLLSMYA